MEEGALLRSSEPQYPQNIDALHFNWFHVSGDLDDFIFYDEDNPKSSER